MIRKELESMGEACSCPKAICFIARIFNAYRVSKEIRFNSWSEDWFLSILQKSNELSMIRKELELREVMGEAFLPVLNNCAPNQPTYLTTFQGVQGIMKLSRNALSLHLTVASASRTQHGGQLANASPHPERAVAGGWVDGWVWWDLLRLDIVSYFD